MCLPPAFHHISGYASHHHLPAMLALTLPVLQASGKMNEIYPVAPWYTYLLVSCSNVIATTCQYEALKYVSFPVQTLGKCAKMMPVMIWGIFILRKRYSLKVRGGAALFHLSTSEMTLKHHHYYHHHQNVSLANTNSFHVPMRELAVRGGGTPQPCMQCSCAVSIPSFHHLPRAWSNGAAGGSVVTFRAGRLWAVVSYG